MKDIFQKMIERLSVDSRITLLHKRWNPNAVNQLVVKLMRSHARKLYNEELSDEITQLSEVANNTHICWQAEVEKRTIGGEFFLKGLAELYNTSFEGQGILKSFGRKLPPAKEMAIFEDHPEFGDAQLVLVHRKNAKSKTSLWFYQAGYVYPMNLSYREYFERLCETRGTAWWQLFFCDFNGDADNAEQHKIRMEEALKAMGILFPETNYSSYQEILDKLW